MILRPAPLPGTRAARLTMPWPTSNSSTAMPGMVSRRISAATLATAPVSPGGLGEAAAIRRCAVVTTAARSMAANCWRMSACGKAAFPDADGLRERPADDQIDESHERED